MNEPVIQTKKTRKKFDNTFKQRAVELWLNSGRAAVAVAVELGIHPQRLSVWRRRFAPRRTIGSRKYQSSARERLSPAAAGYFKKTLGILSETPTSGFNGSTR